MKTKLILRNGNLGSDNAIFCEYNIHTWQGRKALAYWVKYLEEKQGLPVTIYNRQDNREIPRAWLK